MEDGTNVLAISPRGQAENAAMTSLENLDPTHPAATRDRTELCSQRFLGWRLIQVPSSEKKRACVFYVRPAQRSLEGRKGWPVRATSR